MKWGLWALEEDMRMPEPSGAREGCFPQKIQQKNVSVRAISPKRLSKEAYNGNGQNHLEVLAEF
jgi:hypothetical protein